MMKIKLKIAW